MSRFVIPFLLLMALLAMKMSVPYLGECMLLLVSGWLVGFCQLAREKSSA